MFSDGRLWNALCHLHSPYAHRRRLAPKQMGLRWPWLTLDWTNRSLAPDLSLVQVGMERAASCLPGHRHRPQRDHRLSVHLQYVAHSPYEHDFEDWLLRLAMVLDFIILCLCSFRLYRSRGHSGIQSLLFRDGIVSNLINVW